MAKVGPGTLKVVTGSSGSRPLGEALAQVLRQHVREEDVRHLHDDVLLVYTESATEAVRDWAAGCLGEGESVFVAEFESWSGYGPTPERDWLRDRGH